VDGSTRAGKSSSCRSWLARSVQGLALSVLVAAVSAVASGTALGATARLPAKTCNYSAPVYFAVSVNPGTGITSMDFQFTYDAAVVRARALYRTPLTTSYSLTYDVSTPGVVTAHLTGGAPLSGNGDVVWVQLDPLGGSGTSTALTWVSASFNAGGIPASTINGSLSLVTPGTLISVPTAMYGNPGSNVSVFVHATAFTGGDSFDLDLAYDPAVVTATLVEKGPLAQPLTLAYNIGTPGIIRIALFGTQTVNGPGDLVKITFNVNGPLGSATPIDVTRGNINEGAIPTTLQAGLFTVCLTADADGDTYSACTGDCNDANPAVHPGAPDAICDGIDQNCDGTPDDGFAPQTTSCGVGACASSGTTSCTGGIPHDSCAPGSPAPEACNGADDDCNGAVDDVPVPTSVSGVMLIPQDVTTLVTWSGVANAASYDVVRGSLASLASSQGDFTVSTGLCVANDRVDIGVGDFPSPPTGDGFWYLVRGSNCGHPGTYDSGAPSQVGSRDVEISASPNACP